MTSDCEDVRMLVQALAAKIELSWKLLSAQHLANCMFGLQGLSSAEVEGNMTIHDMSSADMTTRRQGNSISEILLIYNESLSHLLFSILIPHYTNSASFSPRSRTKDSRMQRRVVSEANQPCNVRSTEPFIGTRGGTYVRRILLLIIIGPIPSQSLRVCGKSCDDSKIRHL